MMDSVGKSPSYDFTIGWALNPDADAASFEAKAPYVDNGTGLISPDRYYDPRVMRAEWDRLWTRTWQIAGRVSDIPEAGDFLKLWRRVHHRRPHRRRPARLLQCLSASRHQAGSY
jgi:hypothetical protein